MKMQRKYFDWHSGAMKAKGKESFFPLHSFVSSMKFNFGKRESVTKMQGSVHIWVCHTSKEFGIFFSQFIHSDIGF
jgi:hypothetical protein